MIAMPKRVCLNIRVQLTLFSGVYQGLANFIIYSRRNHSHFLLAFNTSYNNSTAMVAVADELLFFKRFA
jgi:hypothetical protein